MGKHALLSASSSHRWLNCPPSARLCEKYEDTGSEYAQEGTDAHSLCEYKLKQALGMDAADPTENLSFYNEEMEQCASDYAAYVLELVEDAKKSCKDPVVLIEQRLDFSRFVKDGFGTGDCVIIADGTLDIVDYKHGKGVEVSAIENPQMMLYALGALELFDGIYDIDTVRMTIFQPRRENVSVCVMAKDDLLQWAHNDLTYKAKLAYEGSGEFACGDWCRFCKAKAVCRKRAEYNLELAKYDFEMPDTLEDAEIAAILDKADELAAWAADVKEYALRQALSGTEYPGYKVVEGRSNRRYISEDAVADAVSQAGYDPYAKKVLGLTEMQKLLGKKMFSTKTQELFTSWQNGGATQKQVIDSIVADIAGCTNQQEALNLAALAFGTMAEDGNLKFITSLTSVGSTYDSVKGSAQGLFDATTTPMQEMESNTRKLQQSLVPLGEKLAEIANTILPPLVSVIQTVSGWFAQLPGPVQNFIVILGALLAAFTALTPVIAALAVSVGALNISLLPIIAVIAAVAAAIAGIIAIIQNWGAITEWFGNLWNTICTGIGTMIESVKTWFSNLWTHLQNVWNGICNVVQTAVMLLGSIIQGAVDIICKACGG